VSGVTSQPDLDPSAFSAAVSAVTSAFGDPTRREIYLYVRAVDHDRVHEPGAARGVTAAAVAAHFDLHPNVARHHLEKLAGGGYLEVELARRGDAAGRPSKRYRAAGPDPTVAPPARRDELLATLLTRAIERLDPDDAANMADEVGYEYGRSLAARMAGKRGPAGEGAAPGATTHRSVRAALAVVADALTAHGFDAHTEQRGARPVIVAEHCPFGEAATRYPHVVCAVDRGLIRGMLAGLHGDTQPRFTETRPSGDDHCVARV